MKYSIHQSPAHYANMFAKTLTRPFEKYLADKIRQPLNIRRTLILLLSLFGLILIGLLWSVGSSAYRTYSESIACLPEQLNSTIT